MNIRSKRTSWLVQKCVRKELFPRTDAACQDFTSKLLEAKDTANNLRLENGKGGILNSGIRATDGSVCGCWYRLS